MSTEKILTEIANERDAQKQRWGTEHDDEHVDGELALRAGELAIAGTPGRVVVPEPDAWELVRKHDRRRRLVIAAALLVAEIERIDRSAS